MALRKIVKIDESKCNGCGLCIPNCAEGALEIIDGKAKLVKDIYCDGLGACLGHCPQDAIEIIEREAGEFDEEAVEDFLKSKEEKSKIKKAKHVSCPGSQTMQFSKNLNKGNVKVESQLTHWPVQLKLAAPNSPHFYGSDLLITVDCVPFAYGNYHNDFLKGKSVVVGCPKLDDNEFYKNKLEQIIKINDLESITVLKMEVPCCSGISMAAKQARDNSGVDIPIKVITIGIKGDIKSKEYI